MSERLLEITDQNFETIVMNSETPVLVDFWAPWCGPCKMLTPIIEDIAEEYEGKVVFGKLNVDDNPQVASKYGIVSIPTILFVKDGKVIGQHVGLLAKDPMKKKIDEFVG